MGRGTWLGIILTKGGCGEEEAGRTETDTAWRCDVALREAYREVLGWGAS